MNTTRTRRIAASILAASLALAACGSSETPIASTEQESTSQETTATSTETEPEDDEPENSEAETDEATPVDQVVALLESIENGDPGPAAIINPNNYVQHDLTVADGLEGFGAVLAQLPEGSARVDVIRAFSDGEFVFTHTDYDFFGPKIGFDIFRYEDGLIVEHWDNLQTTPEEPNPSGRTMIDGPTEATDLDLTDENKQLVEQFVQQVLVDGDLDALPGFFDGDDYIQHNPKIADGVSGLSAALAEFADQGIDIVYDEIHMVLGQGNFVLVTSEGILGDQPTAFYDLFRVENGFIAEHWDVIETIIPESERQNDNGKF